jgi:hypothetical protein
VAVSLCSDAMMLIMNATGIYCEAISKLSNLKADYLPAAMVDGNASIILVATAPGSLFVQWQLFPS